MTYLIELVQWFPPAIPKFGKLKQEDYYEFENSQNYIVSSRSVWLWCETLSQEIFLEDHGNSEVLAVHS